MALSIPPPTQLLVMKESGAVTEPWYRVFAEISRIRTELDALKRLTKDMGAIDMSATFRATFVGSD